MKRFLIALLILCSAVAYAASYDTKITLRNGTYQPEAFLKVLQEKSGSKFIYNERLLEAMKPVKVGATNVMTLKGWLDFAVDRSKMVVTFVGDYILISSRHSDSAVQALGGTSQKGVVRDSDGESVVGAFVQVVGTQTCISCRRCSLQALPRNPRG